MMAFLCASLSGTLINLGCLQRIATKASIARCRPMSNTSKLILFRRFSLSYSAGYSLVQRNIRYQPWRRQNHHFSSSKPSTSSNGNGTGSSPPPLVASESRPTETSTMTMWQRFLAPKLMPERHTFAWYREVLLICTVFAITGSSTMLVGYF
jgi:hypothetical protein